MPGTSPPPSKRRKLNKNNQSAATSINEIVQDAALLTLSDDVLLYVFKFLTSPQLLTLAETCKRIERICEDPSLWKKADFSNCPPMELKSVKKCLKRLHSRTEFIALEGFLRTKGKISNLSEALFSDMCKTCENLSTLKLHNCYIHGDQIKFEHFPKNLKHLSLNGCEIINLPVDRSYFKNIDENLKHLESLDLSGCGWVKSHCLMAICKLEYLKILNLKGCFKIGNCFAYTALAARFGFNQLRCFDLRGTNVSDSELGCFGRKENLKELLVGGEYADQITDRSLQSICATIGEEPPPAALERLTLQQTQVSDEGLKILAKELKTLRYLDVRGSPVTKEGIDLFMRENNDCNLIHDS